MMNLLRKDWLVTRWVHLAGLVFGLAPIVQVWAAPQSSALIAVFCQIMYAHLVFSINQQAAVSRADNLLLNSLPLTRDRIVRGKYVFSLLSAVLYAAYLCLVGMVSVLLGATLAVPPFAMWLPLASVGVFYHLLLMPVAYLNSRYAAMGSLLVYMGILIVPQRLGKGIGAEQTAAFLARLSGALKGWTVPALLLAAVVAAGWASYAVSCRLYRRAEF